MKMEEHPAGSPAPVIDNPDVAEVLVDNISGLLFSNGIFSLTFTVMRNDTSKEPSPQFRQVVARLAVPGHALQQITQHLQQIIGQLESAGHLPAPQPATSANIQ